MNPRRILTAFTAVGIALTGVLLGQGSAQAVDNPGGTLTPGTAVTATITRSTDTASYTWAATKGRHVTFDVTASHWDNNSPNQGNVALKLFDAGGVLKKTCAFENPAYWCDLTPDSTGTWKAQLVPGVASTGSATFALWPDPPTAAITAGTSFTMTAAHQGSQATYTFPATAGRPVTFDTSASTWSTAAVYLYFSNPGGAAFGSRCQGAEVFCKITPDVSGTWNVAYRPDSGATGSVKTVFQPDIAGSAIVSGTPVTTTITAQGQDATYPWQATAGRATTVTVTAASWTSGLFTNLQAYDTGGTLRTSCVVQTPRTCTFTPATGGAWTVKVDPSGVATGSMTFRFS